jgi:hypothetical protein
MFGRPHHPNPATWSGTEQAFAARAMMGRIGEPEDVANAVVFLWLHRSQVG